MWIQGFSMKAACIQAIKAKQSQYYTGTKIQIVLVCTGKLWLEGGFLS